MVFKKGSIPWNKGTKGIMKPNSGSFKKGQKVTEEIKEKLRQKRKLRIGKLSPGWKGGRFLTGYGYVLVYCPNHPYCNYQGYVREHRLVMEEHLGRYLTKEEKVHHINGIKNDNRIENLVLLKNESKHRTIHNLLNNPMKNPLTIKKRKETIKNKKKKESFI